MRTRAVLARGAASAVRRGRRLLATERDRRVADWIEAGHDKTLRLDYDLDQSSLVFDLGGFEGQWASDIYARFRCRILVFEPVAEFAERIRRRFARNPDVVVHGFGLAAETREATIRRAGVGSSLYGDERGLGAAASEPVLLRRADEFLAGEGMERVDLMKVNIEGGEYDLLSHLIDTALVERITNLQVQFHDFVPDAERRMHEIQAGLRRTHVPAWQTEWVWESWTLREGA